MRHLVLYTLFLLHAGLFASNVMYIDTVSVINGESLTLTIGVNNFDEFSAFQFSIELPEIIDFEYSDIHHQQQQYQFLALF